VDNSKGKRDRIIIPGAVLNKEEGSVKERQKFNTGHTSLFVPAFASTGFKIFLYCGIYVAKFPQLDNCPLYWFFKIRKLETREALQARLKFFSDFFTCQQPQ
jgi:hypothetical protein